MKKIKLLILFIVCYVFSITYVDAEVCDEADVERLKVLAQDVEVSYDYIGDDELFDRYQISVAGLFDELMVSFDGHDYYYDSTQEGSLSFYRNSGTYSFEFYSTSCPYIILTTKNIKLPKFNMYSQTSECQKLKDYKLDICDEWYQSQINDVTFYSIINQYLSEDNTNISYSERIKKFFDEYYLIMTGVGIAIIVIVVGIIIHRKRSVLE
ncbi:MAG: hypothetical protein ACI4U0_00030 [Candidatus Aphodocola sp.]